MDLETVLYIVAGIIYLIFSAGKAAKKKPQGKSQPARPQKKSNWEETLRELLREQQGTPATKTTVEPKIDPEPVLKRVETMQPESIDQAPAVPEWQVYLQEKEKEMAEHKEKEYYSIENDPMTLAEHLHHSIEDTKTGHYEPSLAYEITHGEPFDARKAFVYGEIFHRKY